MIRRTLTERTRRMRFDPITTGTASFNIGRESTSSASEVAAPIADWISSFPFLSPDCCPSIKNVLLLDSEGKRVAVKYYTDDWPTLAAKLAYEKSIFTKTLKTNARTEAEIAMLDGYIVVYKFIQDLHFFVTGGDDENELIIATVLQGFFDAVGLLLRNNVDKRSALENLDLILLCLDEIVDGGIVLETEPSVIASKVAANSLDGATSLSEQLIHKN
ncbi:hypothetical protein MUK42_11933 [Musa troglodytarum]|uniref:Coatomer subunit zeta n=1 Tax=Musa troglodytarum TaxID=320322 RepID=A0A9E7GTM1_9LILI|nr:hypothetical protein MUK42_11933 [Musa troglodytarum]